MPHPVFADEPSLRDAFIDGLERLLDHDTTGTYILVLANAAYDPAVWAHLEGPLRERFVTLAERYRETLRAGRPLPDPADDAAVFLRLMAIGFDGLQRAEARGAGPWSVAFNPVRALRPARMSGAPPAGMYRPFDPQGFHFNKPFLRKEVFWSGELLGRPVELLYNKFPFAELHGLLVPERETERPQYLERELHAYLWGVTETLGTSLPGVGFGYNSVGACASVNHLHFQMFVRPEPFPVTAGTWRHNGGDRPYPACCHAFADPAPAWDLIEALHAEGTPYNLLYTPGRLYCLPRRAQGSVDHAAWAAGLAWAELAGGFTTFNRDDYEGLDAAAIETELARLQPETAGCEAA